MDREAAGRGECDAEAVSPPVAAARDRSEKRAEAEDRSSCGTSGAKASRAGGPERPARKIVRTQKETSVRLATLAVVREACKARHSA
jgi:hypothetical protein